VAEASYPDDLSYHAEHDWARVDGDTATLFDPPEVGTQIAKDTPYAEVESVKAVSDVIAPVSGEIVEVNEALKDSPEQINDDSYGEGWLVKVKLSDPAEIDALMDSDKYQESLS
jgi:glycine cleavage system H protein